MSKMLLVAAMNGDLSAVKTCLQDPSVNLDYKDGVGRTPLIWAIMRGHIPMIELLLEKGAARTWLYKADKTNRQNWLIYAVLYSEVNAVNSHPLATLKFLIDRLTPSVEELHLILRCAALHGKITVLNYLLDELRVPLQVKDYIPFPLNYPNIKDDGSVFIYSLLTEKLAVIESLLKRNPDAWYTEKSSHGCTLFLEAAAKGRMEIIDFLLQRYDHETLFKQKTPEGWDAYSLALINNRSAIAEKLLSLGCYYNIGELQDSLYQALQKLQRAGKSTPLRIYEAARENRWNIIPAVINARNIKQDGNTLLHIAIMNNNFQDIIALLQGKANFTSIRNKTGETVYELAKRLNCLPAIAMMEVITVVNWSEKPTEKNPDSKQPEKSLDGSPVATRSDVQNDIPGYIPSDPPEESPGDRKSLREPQFIQKEQQFTSDEQQFTQKEQTVTDIITPIIFDRQYPAIQTTIQTENVPTKPPISNFEMQLEKTHQTLIAVEQLKTDNATQAYILSWARPYLCLTFADFLLRSPLINTTQNAEHWRQIAYQLYARYETYFLTKMSSFLNFNEQSYDNKLHLFLEARKVIYNGYCDKKIACEEHVRLRKILFYLLFYFRDDKNEFDKTFKPSLAAYLMDSLENVSKVPISKLYDSLSHEEKERFKNIIMDVYDTLRERNLRRLALKEELDSLAKHKSQDSNQTCQESLHRTSMEIKDKEETKEMAESHQTSHSLMPVLIPTLTPLTPALFLPSSSKSAHFMETPYYKCIAIGDLKAFHELIKQQPLNSEQTYQATMAAAQFGRIEILDSLLEKETSSTSINITHKSSDGLTINLKAVLYRQLGIIEYIHGKYPDLCRTEKDAEGRTAFLLASKLGYTEILSFLALKLDIETLLTETCQRGLDPFATAIQNNQPAAAKLLLRLGAYVDLSEPDFNHVTSVCKAIHTAARRLLQYLDKLPVDIKYKNDDLFRDLKTLEGGAFNGRRIKDKKRRTALHIAIELNRVDDCVLIASMQEDNFNVKDAQGNTVLMMAQVSPKEHSEIACVLKVYTTKQLMRAAKSHIQHDSAKQKRDATSDDKTLAEIQRMVCEYETDERFLALEFNKKREFLKIYISKERSELLKCFDKKLELSDDLCQHLLETLKLLFKIKPEFTVGQTSLYNTRVSLRMTLLVELGQLLSNAAPGLAYRLFEQVVSLYSFTTDETYRQAKREIITLFNTHRRLIQPCGNLTSFDFRFKIGMVHYLEVERELSFRKAFFTSTAHKDFCQYLRISETELSKILISKNPYYYDYIDLDYIQEILPYLELLREQNLEEERLFAEISKFKETVKEGNCGQVSHDGVNDVSRVRCLLKT